VTARWQASPRRRRRDLLLLAGLAPSLVGLLVAVVLLVMLGRQAAGVAATGEGRHHEARQWFAQNRWFGTVEHWVAPYNEGVASFRAGDPGEALADFVAALRDVPPEHECLVRHNIALTREVIGDEATGSAEAAMDDYRAGREALSQGGCEDRVPGADEPRAALADGTTDLAAASAAVDARLEQKILALLAEQERLESADLTEEQRERRRRLEEQEQRAQEREQRRQDRADEQQEQPEQYGW
jgi:hypothetical protein